MTPRTEGAKFAIAIVLYIIGWAAVIICGIWFVTACASANFGSDCDGQTMKQGDTCVEMRSGDETSFEEGQDIVARGQTEMMVTGAGFLIGLGMIFVGNRLGDD
ncbi:hypothetical protein ACFXJ8_10930 [Nonomuraea sp. NPDC059194]|uniref:hypothetical protein n=1 Tax=Nonomuraea sp. NPDC059194 TaxID=3346764 RepID=UPI0036AF0AD6